MHRRLLTLVPCLLLLTGSACKGEESGKDDKKTAKADGAEAKEGAAKAGEPAEADGEPGKADPAKADADPAKADPAKANADPAADPAAAGSMEVATGGEPRYELLETGAEPRQELRFTPTAGQVDRTKLSMGMEFELDFGGAMPGTKQAAPEMVLTNMAETVSVADGRITEKVVFESFELGEASGGGANEMMASMMRGALEKLEGFEQQLVYNDRGGLIEGKLSIPEGADDQIKQNLENIGNSLEQVMVRLPEPAVGVGAKWREISEIENNGVKIEQTSEYEITAIDGRKVTLSTTVTQKPLTKEISAPGMPPNVEVEMLEFDSSGGGEVVFDLDKMLPVSGASKMNTMLKVKADAAGQSQEVTTRIKLDIKVEGVTEG